MSIFNPSTNIAEQYRRGVLCEGVIYGPDGRQVAGPKPIDWMSDSVVDHFKQAAIDERIQALRRSVGEARK